mgnify:CR=1 FL=1
MKNNLIYLDNSATTRMDERVLEAMKPYLFDTYAVATSEFAYSMGIDAKEAQEDARDSISFALGGTSNELIFTSGGTESSNLAIKGAVKAVSGEKKGNIIVSKIEDFPVLNSARTLEKEGYDVTYLDVDEYGFVDMEQLRSSINEDTILVSIQHANQEIGTVNNIGEIGKICRERGVLFHTDATHTFMRLPVDVEEIPVDLITLSAHTIHGPRGIGALYVREDTPLSELMDGGFQEFGKRAGVENIPGAVGFSRAVELITPEENECIAGMRKNLTERILDGIPGTTLNGHPEKRTPQNANITFHLVEGESITLHLDMRGIAVSTGSACFSRSLEASHVIMGIGGDHERAHGSVRFTFGRFNREEEINKVFNEVRDVIEKLREISPLKEMGGEK